MKKIIILVLFSQIAFAQFNIFGKNPIINKENFDKQKWHYGYYLGFNSLDFKTGYKSIVAEEISVETTTGFNVGIVGNLRLTNHLDLRFEPGLYITQRNLNYPGFTEERDALREVKSTYIFFPLLVKFSATRAGNIKPYLLGGVSRALNLSSNFDSADDNQNQVFRMNKWTNFYEVGFGIDLYLEYFKFSPSIRGVFSLNDELIQDNNAGSPWTSNIDTFTTRGVFVNFTFH